LGNMDTRRSIRSTRAARDKADTRSTGNLADRFRHHGGAAFMTANGNGDAAVAKRIQNRKKALTGNAEDMLDAIDQELIDQRCGSGSARYGLVH
jgi:hypothetical protein